MAAAHFKASDAVVYVHTTTITGKVLGTDQDDVIFKADNGQISIMHYKTLKKPNWCGSPICSPFGYSPLTSPMTSEQELNYSWSEASMTGPESPHSPTAYDWNGVSPTYTPAEHHSIQDKQNTDAARTLVSLSREIAIY